MKGKSPGHNQLNLYKQRLADQLNPKNPLYRLAENIPWDYFEAEFSKHYSHTGRTVQPIRLMEGLVSLKQLRNLSDEMVVERWIENGYHQFFCREAFLQREFLCRPTDSVYFRKRIEERGIEQIFQVSIDLHGVKALGREILVGKAVQEKNITFPTDTKLYKKIPGTFADISYLLNTKKLVLAQRFLNHPMNYNKATKAACRLKTIASRLVRDLERKLPSESFNRYLPQFRIFEKVLNQQKYSSNKIYSIHEYQVSYVGKGEDHKKYEFGAKASVTVTKNSCIIVGAVSHSQVIHDSKALIDVISQSSELRGQCAEVAICDRGCRVKSKIGETRTLILKPTGKKATAYQRQNARKRFRRRAGIELIIGHLKSDSRIVYNYLNGSIDDIINFMLTAAAFNFRKWMQELQDFFGAILIALILTNKNKELIF